MMSPQRKWEIHLSTNKPRQFALAIKMLTKKNNLREGIVDLGLSTQELKDLLETVLAEQEEFQELVMYEPNSTVSGRIFSPLERLVLSLEAQRFLLAALHTAVITPLELEQTLALLTAQTTTGFVEIEELLGILESVVQDQLRMAVLISSEWDYVH